MAFSLRDVFKRAKIYLNFGSLASFNKSKAALSKEVKIPPYFSSLLKPIVLYQDLRLVTASTGT
jgi:hypothetical protein